MKTSQSKVSKFIRANSALRFIDASKQQEFSYHDLLDIFLVDNSSGLMFVYVENSVACLSAFFSAMESDATLVLLSSKLPEEFKRNLENQYFPNIIIDPQREGIDNYKFKKLENSACCLNSFWQQEDVLGYINETKIAPEIKLLLSTSGTTGSPKLVKLSEVNLFANSESIASYLPISSEDVAPLNLPINYSYGLSVLLSNCMFGGKILVTNEDFLTRKFWDDYNKYNCNSFAGVPINYEILDRIGFRNWELNRLKYFTQAGGKLSEVLIEKFGQYAINSQSQFFIMYGATEATARMSYLPPQYLESKRGSIGIPIKGGEFRIDDISGELIYKGPNIFGGYAQNPRDLEFWENQSELRTGDLARVDNDGYYFITGRIKRIVKLSGNRINLDEVERFLDKKTKYSFKAIGVEDKYLCLFNLDSESQFESNTEILTDDEKNTLKKVLQMDYKIHPTQVKFKSIFSYPLTSNGKVDYIKLKDLI